MREFKASLKVKAYIHSGGIIFEKNFYLHCRYSNVICTSMFMSPPQRAVPVTAPTTTLNSFSFPSTFHPKVSKTFLNTHHVVHKHTPDVSSFDFFFLSDTAYIRTCILYWASFDKLYIVVSTIFNIMIKICKA